MTCFGGASTPRSVSQRSDPMTTPSIPQKQCKTCGEQKPLTPIFFRLKDKWFVNECRDCFNLRRNQARRTDDMKRYHRTDRYDFKVCPDCGIKKPATLEYFHKKNSGIASHCKECRGEHNSTYGKTHRAEKAANMREWRKRNPERALEISREGYRRNPAKRMQATRDWARRHPEASRAAARKRRALKYENGGSHTDQDIHLLYQSQKGLCWWCEKPVGKKYHVDHRVPLSRGGSDDARNLCISCPACNNSKYNKLPHEWGDRLL